MHPISRIIKEIACLHRSKQQIQCNGLDLLKNYVSVYDKETCLPVAPYIQFLINHVAKDKVFALDKNHKQFKPTKEINMFDPKKMEASH